MKRDFRRTTLTTGGWLLAAVLGFGATGAAIIGPEPGTAVAAADPDAPTVTSPRVCAAAAAYAIATGDHWDQRAAIARAALNRFDALGHVPDCGRTLTTIVAAGVDSRLWQASLDAVDAVQSGSYALPDACVRADTVSPLPRANRRFPTLVATPAGAPPVSSPAARTHCVIGDLAFFEGGAL
jgi:hypothetical protein